ncbi:thymidylate synthase [Pseudomonas phage PIP]|nr:thymidylate synthase [Pseudomonas phage PIP]
MFSGLMDQPDYGVRTPSLWIVLDHEFIVSTQHVGFGPSPGFHRSVWMDYRSGTIRSHVVRWIGYGRTRGIGSGLADYLVRNSTSPFGIEWNLSRMRLPIFVARQFVRHRTATINRSAVAMCSFRLGWYIPGSWMVGLPTGTG